MKWETVKLESLCSVITKGTTPSNIGEAFTDSGINYIRSEMLTSSKFISGEFLHISEETHNKLKRSQLHANDILFSMAGVYLGKTAILRPEDVPANTNQAVALIRVDEAKAIPEYVYYTLNIPQIVKRVNTVQSQSAQPNINLKQIGNLDIPLPSIEKQMQVVDILAAYDSLIENNQKQIKLLEEAAQRLYKEWFIGLRFPGYETTPVHDGVPEGWENVPIDNAFSIKYGKNLPTSLVSKSGRYPVYGANGVIGFYKEKNCDDYVVLITSRGNGSGDVLRTLHKESFVTNNSFIVVGKRSSLGVPFSHQMMMSADFKSVCTGSAQPQLTNNSISTLNVILPSEHLIENYNKLADPMYETVINLVIQNDLLIEARDRLLPKLMNGEIEV